MHIDDLAALMDRYRQGKCSPEEKKIIEEWYDTLPFRQPSLDDAEVDASLDKVFKGLQENIRSPAQMSDASVRHMNQGHVAGHWRYKRIMSAAAMVALAIGVYWASQYGWSRWHQPTVKEDDVVVSTVSGELKKMVLSDGSIVQLNANSTIQYPRQFAGEYRQVTLLTGEAFFQVAPDAAHPFTVKASNLKTLVLGTSFNIRSYAKDSSTVIALISGKVQVSTPNDKRSLVLDPHDLLRYGKVSGSMDKGHFEKETEVDAWKQRAMNFKDASFEEIAFEIDNMYNVPVVNLSTKKHWSYTGYFGSESVWEIIRTICITENLSYQFHQGHIILINKN